jgi:imidazolonepropionase-like amidohydrolase
MKNIIAAALTLTLLGMAAMAQQPSEPQKKSILLMNGVAHLGNGQVIENSVIGFKDGKLTLVANAETVRLEQGAYDEVINIQGKHVYPGFIAPNTTLGLVEIDAVRATVDIKDVGVLNPNIRSVIAYNTDSKILPTIRSNGVLLTQVAPRGGLITGTSSVMELDGWNWEDAVLKMDDGVHMSWPSLFSRSWNWEGPGDAEKNKQYENQVSMLKKFFQDAKAYSEAEKTEEKNLRFEAMRGIFKGTQNLYIRANYVKDITESISFAKQFGIKKIVIIGGRDSWMVTDMLKELNVSVMVNRTHDLPERPEDDLDLPYKLPYLLQKAGVLFCLQNEGDMEAPGARNLPFLAGTAAAYGLTKEEAVASVTSNAAKILGIDNMVGTLEVGKNATLFISTGDALDIRTNNVELAYIDGRLLDLNNDQKELYEKYKKKYGSN